MLTVHPRQQAELAVKVASKLSEAVKVPVST
jgi:hypothetical protein